MYSLKPLSVTTARRTLWNAVRMSFTTTEEQRVRSLNSLKYELDNNPMFDRAFPQFKGKKPETTVVRK